MFDFQTRLNMFKMNVHTFGSNYRVATLSTLYLTVSESGIIMSSLKSVG